MEITDSECPLCKRYGKHPNAETVAAMEELDNGGGKQYFSYEEWRESLWEEMLRPREMTAFRRNLKRLRKSDYDGNKD